MSRNARYSAACLTVATCLTPASSVAACTVHCIILRVTRAVQLNLLSLCISFVHEYEVHINTEDVHWGELYCKEEIL